MRLFLGPVLCLILSGAVLAAPVETPFVLVAVGDLSFADGLGQMILAQGPDYPWRETSDILQSGGLLLANLEVPVSLRGAVWIKKRYLLHADPRTAEALGAGGFDLVSLANNHMMDFGAPALLDTVAALDALGIAHAGAGPDERAARAPALVKLGPLRLAFLGYCRVHPSAFRAGQDRPGTAWCSDQEILADIAAAKGLADLVVVSMHWGQDYNPLVANSTRNLAHACIDGGASIVLGHHPHILQAFEVYRRGLIAYSLGNFAFGSMNKKAKDSAVLRLSLDAQGRPRRAEIYPVNVYNSSVRFQTRRRHGADAIRVIGNLRRLSAPYGTEIETEGEIGVIEVGE